jgi:glycosyltransferase involved in cell wall biosynthesis
VDARGIAALAPEDEWPAHFRLGATGNGVKTSILFTIPNFITAGSGRAMLNIVERLDRTRFAPGVCVRRRGGNLDAEVERMGVPLLEAEFTVAGKPYRSLPQRARLAAAAFRDHRYDIWHSFNYAGEYTEPLIARFAGARAWIYTKKNMNWHKRSWYLRTLFASRVAAQNTAMRDSFFSHAAFRGRTRLIPRGVDTNRFRPDNEAAMGMRDSLGIGRDAIVVGCIAHLLPVKAQHVLVRAMASTPGAHLWLAGADVDDDYSIVLHDAVNELQLQTRVHFLGAISDVPGLLSELNIFVLPSRMEGSPVALLEALSSGLPCVASDIPAARDVIEHGETGWLVTQGDVEALAEALQTLAASRELRTRFGAAARQRVLDRYRIEREVADHELLYDEIVSSPWYRLLGRILTTQHRRARAS